MVSTRSSGGVKDAKSFRPHSGPPRRVQSSSTDPLFEDRKYHRIAQDSRNALATVQLPASSTNASVELVICAALAPISPTRLTIISYAPVGTYFDLPSCLASSSLTNLDAPAMIVSDWSFLPTTLQSLFLSTALFVPNSTSSYGYDSSGNLAWPDIWSRFPSLNTLAITASRLTSLPESLPNGIVFFEVSSNAQDLGGIPPDLLQNYHAISTISSLAIVLTSARLSGTIPESLLEPLREVAIESFEISLTSNALIQSIPPSFLAPLVPFGGPSSLTSLTLRFGGNMLTGSIVNGFFSAGLMKPGVASSLFFDISSNRIAGPIPELFFDGISSMRSVWFLASNNLFTGSLPNQLFNNDTWQTDVASRGLGTLSLMLQNNPLLSGTIPSNLLSSSFPNDDLDFAMSGVTLDLSNTLIAGSLPRNFLARDIAVRRDSASYQASQARHLEDGEYSRAATMFVPVEFDYVGLTFQNMTLSGIVPDNLLAESTLSVGRLSLDCSYNWLIGTFPDILSTLADTNTLTIDMSHNQLFGNPPTSCNGRSSLIYTFSHNKLDGYIAPDTLSDCQSLTLDVGDNPQLSGEIPAEFFKIPTMRLAAPRTNLTGTVPVNMTSSFGSIDFAGTLIDFCESPIVHPNFNFTTTNCVLNDTNAACVCPDAYEGCARKCNSAVAPAAGGSTLCPENTRPSVEFVCVNGVWTAPFTSTPVLTIPSGAGTVVVDGNVTSTSIVINGVGSNIVIRGCAANLTTVTVALTQEQLKQLGSSKTLQTLLTFSNASECGISLNGLALDTKVSQGCRKVRTEKVVSSDGNTFGAYFTVNSSGCNGWWIILVSVICGVIVLGMVAAIVAGVLWKQHQKKKDFDRLAGTQSVKR